MFYKNNRIVLDPQQYFELNCTLLNIIQNINKKQKTLCIINQFFLIKIFKINNLYTLLQVFEYKENSTVRNFLRSIKVCDPLLLKLKKDLHCAQF